MNLKCGYSHGVFEANYHTLRTESLRHDQALAAAYDHARRCYWKKFPDGACPAWMVRKGDSRLNPLRKKNPANRRKNPVPESSQSAKRSRDARIKAAGDLYTRFTGHDADEIVSVDKPVLPDVMLTVGDIDGILYTTVRDGKVEKYIHKFKKNCRPLFCVSHDGEQLFMLGGSYDFTERGIVDRS